MPNLAKFTIFCDFHDFQKATATAFLKIPKIPMVNFEIHFFKPKQVKSKAKYFSLDMNRRVKLIEQDKKIFFTLFTFEVQIFQLLQTFLTAKPIRLLS